MSTETAPAPVYTPRREREREREKEAAAEEEASEARHSWVTEGLTWLVVGVCLAGWAAIGLFLWLPLLLRAMVRFSVALVYATITGSSAEEPARELRRAADFYRRGFISAVRAVGSTRGDEPEGGWQLEMRPLLGELAWALVLWYPVLWWVGLAPLSPAELVTAAFNLPWRETLGGLVQRAVEIPIMLRDFFAA